MEEKNETFTYTYSATQREEVKRIREKYAPPTQEEGKMEQLYRLDQSVTKPGLITALIMGIISTLIMGVGMSCTMVWGETLFVPGIIIGIVGIIGVCATYPIYIRITKKQREKLTPEIMRLADELMK